MLSNWPCNSIRPILRVLNTKLQSLEHQIENKILLQRTLVAKKESESKTLQLISQEIQELRSLRSEVLRNVEQTEAWTTHLGQWRVKILDVSQSQKVQIGMLYQISQICLGCTRSETGSFSTIGNFQIQLFSYKMGYHKILRKDLNHSWI